LLKACLFNDLDLRKPLSNCWNLKYEFVVFGSRMAGWLAGWLAITSSQGSVCGGKVKASKDDF
jgi:hypothetical protein